jgi:hypothetical protein
LVANALSVVVKSIDFKSLVVLRISDPRLVDLVVTACQREQVQIDWRLFKDHAAHRVYRRCNIYQCHKVSIHIQLFNYAAVDKVFQDLPAVAGSTKVVKLVQNRVLTGLLQGQILPKENTET